MRALVDAYNILSQSLPLAHCVCVLESMVDAEKSEEALATVGWSKIDIM